MNSGWIPLNRTKLHQGRVIFASDPFTSRNNGWPWVIVNTTAMPFHGEQFIALTLTSKTWHDKRLPIDSAQIVSGKLPKESAILPWAIGSIDRSDIEDTLAVLHNDLVGAAVESVTTYLEVKSSRNQ